LTGGGKRRERGRICKTSTSCGSVSRRRKRRVELILSFEEEGEEA